MKTIIETGMFNPHLFEIFVNPIIDICTMSKTENELRQRISETMDWHEQTELLRWGFGHNHFWLSELQSRDEWTRIIFVDFTDQK